MWPREQTSPCAVAPGRLEADLLFPSSLRQVFLVCLHAGPPEIQGPSTFIPTVGLSITCTPSTERRKRPGGPGAGPGRGTQASAALHGLGPSPTATSNRIGRWKYSPAACPGRRGKRGRMSAQLQDSSHVRRTPEEGLAAQ